ncbi:MAG: hypothetical protein HIU57_09355 [Acidobacteria bacterium]|nr:hypothetical protein [Acidobacteriota bacterium]
MRYTCATSRLLTAATLGYIGASPLNSVSVSWVCAAAAVAGTLAWRRWVSHSVTACALPSSVAVGVDETEGYPDFEQRESVS